MSASVEKLGAPNGADLIAAERLRQIEVEGYGTDDDASQQSGQLARAAAVYALPDRLRYGLSWPWPPQFFKPTPGDRVRELVKAGALMAAEIDRLLAAPKEDS